ncbi:MAG: peptidyl-tRNA hydrolase Pth2 [Candidatus Woesearchaeota archaeon]
MKQVILVRQDLKLPKGKLAAQVAHASTEAVLRTSKEKVKKWQMHGSKKVVLKVKDEKELIEHNQRAKDYGLVTALITDAGHTTVAPGTRTCVGIGPDDEDKIDLVTGELKMV